jgi:DNA-directed RNA polymerase specialized sigma24 family protein
MTEKKPRKDRVTQADMSHQEIADELGISRAAVSDMEARLLRKIKKALEKRGLTLDDFFGRD